MYYLNYSAVVSAFKKLIVDRTNKLDNGIIGILFLMKNSNESEEISGSKRILFDEKKVENDINHLFAFQEYISTPLSPNTFFILSENFEKDILLNIKKEKIDLLSLAIVCLQSEGFESNLTNEKLINYFIEEFKLPLNFVNTCFEKDIASVDVNYVLTQTSVYERQKQVSTLIPNDSKNPTLVFEGKWLKSLGGSFGQGAYTQKLTATSGLKELVFVPSGLLQNSLSYQGQAIKTAINPFAMNILFFGPSGTGKSTEARKELERKGVEAQNIKQITFHPEYTYSDFVGSLKPNTLYKEGDDLLIYESINGVAPIYQNKEPIVEFRFESGPFVDACINAANSDPKIPFALIIDEINRGNVPEIMGDIFQLLDREEGTYSNSNSELQKYLKQNSKNNLFDNGLIIPNNLYIYATINPADQNVYPLDTAFKRRWKRRFIGINYSHEHCLDWIISICQKDIPWLKFINLVNGYLTNDLELSEDKQLGQFFIKLSSTPTIDEINEETLKVISYLWEDIPKSKRSQVFDSKIKTFGDVYSKLCSDCSLILLFSDVFSAKLNEITELVLTRDELENAENIDS